MGFLLLRVRAAYSMTKMFFLAYISFEGKGVSDRGHRRRCGGTGRRRSWWRRVESNLSRVAGVSEWNEREPAGEIPIPRRGRGTSIRPKT
jgi:hypothetical protein